jgi:hypothetical protein
MKAYGGTGELLLFFPSTLHKFARLNSGINHFEVRKTIPGASLATGWVDLRRDLNTSEKRKIS